MSLQNAGGVLDRGAQIGLFSYWKKKRYEYDSNGNIAYIGKNARIDVGDEESSWAVVKFTWTNSDITLIEGPLTGAWDDRATLDWT